MKAVNAVVGSRTPTAILTAFRVTGAWIQIQKEKGVSSLIAS